jgi:sortase (surface protein transpeptidase)
MSAQARLPGLAGQAAGPVPHRSRRPPPRHRRPSGRRNLTGHRDLSRRRNPLRRRRFAQSAGLLAIGCGLLATALGLGGWALAGQHGFGRPGLSASQGHQWRAGARHEMTAKLGGPQWNQGERGGRSGALASQAGRRGQAGQVPVPGGLAGRAAGGPSQQRIPRPVSLAIPAIGVHTRLIHLGITSQQTLQVPASAAVAGWFTGSPPPGAIGASIIAGHIDSYTGPGVFFRLRDLRRGRDVYVTLATGTTVTFRVTAVRSYAKDRFPTAAVYGPVPDAELRLITCGGQFDYATGSYLANVVVYAVLVR